MKWQQHEESIQNKLRSYSPEVDTDALWSKVGPYPPRKRRRWAAWLFAGLLVTGAAVLIVLSSDMRESTEKTKPDHGSTGSDSVRISQPGTQTPGNIPGESETSDLNQPGEQPNSSDDAASTQPGKVQALNTEETTWPRQQLQAGSVTSSQTRKTQGTQLHTGVDAQATHSSSSSIPKQASVQALQGEVLEQANTLISQDAPAYLISTQAGRELIDSSEKEFPMLRPVLSIQPLHAELKAVAGDQEEFEKAQPMLRPATQKRLSLGVIAGTGYVTDVYMGSASEEYLAKLRNISEPLPSLHANVYVGYRLSKRLSLISGGSYTRLTTRLTHDSKVTEVVEVDGDVIHIGTDGSVTTRPGKTQVTRTTHFHTRHHTYLHTLDVPVLMQYDFLHAPRVRFGIQGGVLFNVRTTGKGAIPDAENTLYYWSKKADNPYQAFQPAFTGGVSVTYLMTPRVAFTMQPQYTYRKTDIRYSTIDVQASYHVFACRFGALFQL